MFHRPLYILRRALSRLENLIGGKAKAGTVNLTMPDLPIVCSLTPVALTARREGLLPGLLTRAQSHQELPQGHRLEFAPTDDTLTAIARTIEAERHCCRFLRFNITVEQDGGPISLELTGPPGTREFISALFDA